MSGNSEATSHAEEEYGRISVFYFKITALIIFVLFISSNMKQYVSGKTYTHITAIKYLEIVKVMEDYDTICERKVEICLQKRMM
ncbi:hypothetical protein T4A_5031, partial [Trichinella pseudospiralis]